MNNKKKYELQGAISHEVFTSEEFKKKLSNTEKLFLLHYIQGDNPQDYLKRATFYTTKKSLEDKGVPFLSVLTPFLKAGLSLPLCYKLYPYIIYCGKGGEMQLIRKVLMFLAQTTMEVTLKWVDIAVKNGYKELKIVEGFRYAGELVTCLTSETEQGNLNIDTETGELITSSLDQAKQMLERYKDGIITNFMTLERFWGDNEKEELENRPAIPPSKDFTAEQLFDYIINLYKSNKWFKEYFAAFFAQMGREITKEQPTNAVAHYIKECMIELEKTL